MPKLGFQFLQRYWIRHLTEAFEQLANALLFGVRGQGGRELLSGNIHTSDDPAASPQGEDDQRNDEHTGHMVRLAITKMSVQLTRAFRRKRCPVYAAFCTCTEGPYPCTPETSSCLFLNCSNPQQLYFSHFPKQDGPPRARSYGMSFCKNSVLRSSPWQFIRKRPY